MIKKLGLWLMLLSLFIQLVPGEVMSTATAATGSFVFQGESASASSPRVVTTERVTLTGTVSNVDPTTISYSVLQLVNNETQNAREDLTSNIYVTGNAITVYNIELFPGLNKVTFTGMKNGGEVSNSIYIEYRNSPMLYNLTANLDGNSFPITEVGTTVVQSTASKGKATANISITGNAPNATGVTIIVNGSSKTYNVNSANNSSFAASPIVLSEGQNTVTFKITNGTQVSTSTRSVAFYNGSVAFIDDVIEEWASSSIDRDLVTNEIPLETALLNTSPKMVVNSGSKFTVYGKVIVPNSYHADISGGTSTPHPDITAAGLNGFAAVLKNVTDKVDDVGPLSIDASKNIRLVGTPEADDPFFIYEYRFDLPSIGDGSSPATTMSFNDRFTVQLSAKNEVNAYLGVTPEIETSTDLYFTLYDETEAFIQSINYLPGYAGGQTYKTISGVTLDGSSIYGLPLAVEVLVGNSNTFTKTIDVTEIRDPYGNSKKNLLAGTDYTVLTYDDPANDRVVNIDGVEYQRVILVFNKMPYEGTQTITMKINGLTTTSSATFTMLYGPYVKFDKIYDSMQIEDDTTLPIADRKKHIIQNVVTAGGTTTDDSALGSFAGELLNINDTNEIRYTSDSSGARTVFFYVNNILIPLVPQNSADAHDTSFIIDSTTKITTTDGNGNSVDLFYPDIAFDALFSGENTIKLVFQGSKNYYEKSVKFNIIPTNLPVIPLDGTTVYPFTYTADNDNSFIVPNANDTNFTLTNGIYTTKESFMNIYGAFDFLDLGTNTTGDPSVVDEKMENLGDSFPYEDYILKVTGTSLSEPLQWDLSEPFQIVNNGTFVRNYPEGATIDSNLIVRYDLSDQTFSFVLKKQELNADGSSSAYVFNVYNSGDSGPKASYRLEVDPTVLPYKILRPYLPAEAIVNKNFVEVVINAKGADSVVINKVAATKSGYDYNNDGDSTDDVDYPNAFRATITGLKVGANKIAYTIQNASDTVSDSFTITYQPTNIPGAQYMEDMKSSHKVFDGALGLTFPKGTSLIRSDYDVPANLKNQVFTGHKLLFGIANPEDGVVDRREYDNVPVDFDLILQNYGTRFRVSFPTRFGKASPVYWIDAGLADNLTTNSYDPVTMGVDPYQYPNNKSGPNKTTIPTYDERSEDLELVTSKRGSLTLSFDPNIRESVGTTITVFHYDVNNKYWVNMGGVVDTKKNTITVPFEQFGYYVVGKMTYSFMDTSNHPYARNYLETMYSKGIMNASSYDDFGVDMYTTRGEFAKMIIEAMELPLNYDMDNPSFDDVAPIVNPDALWDYRYIETAARQGIIRGTQPKTFEPNNSLTRGEAAVILARALELKLDTDSTKIDKALQKAFKDYANISYYAKSSVVAIAKKGYIQGSPVDAADLKKGYVFESQSYLLRSDAAIIIGKVMSDLKKLPKLN